LNININKVEEVVTQMIEDNRLDAKIDRPKQLIKFGGMIKYNESLNLWSKNVYKLINQVEEVVDLLEREGLVMSN